MSALPAIAASLVRSNAAALIEVPVPSPSPVAVLTRGMAAGDEAAFREFYAQFFDRLLRYHFVLARGNEQAARDALQETMTRVARRVRQFEDEEVFWSWLTVVARSAAIDQSRRRQRYWDLLKSYATSFFQRSAGAAEEHVDALLPELLERGLASLAADDRHLLDAKYLRGASQRELASQLGVTEKAIESRLLRLRRDLRRKLEQLLHDELS